MKSLDEYIDLAAQTPGHMRAGQFPGVHMATWGMKLIGIRDPAGRDRKRRVTFIEIDRCDDASPVVTGCRLGKRGLTFRDFGKVAATFCDLKADRAVRVAAREPSKRRATQLYPEITDKKQQPMRAYCELTDQELFSARWVRVTLGREEFPGCIGECRACDGCGEGIYFKHEVIRDGRIRCKVYAGERYHTRL